MRSDRNRKKERKKERERERKKERELLIRTNERQVLMRTDKERNLINYASSLDDFSSSGILRKIRLTVC